MCAAWVAMLTPRRANWTVSEKAELAAMVSKGKPYADIATALGRTENAVQQQASRLKLLNGTRMRRQPLNEKSKRKPRSAAWFLS